MTPLRPITDLFRRLRVKRTNRTGSLDKLQKHIGYRFRTQTLLTQALTHKSSISPDDTKGLLSNERLEFLGDAVLNCLITEHLYLSHPEKSEGQLSKIKSLVVSRKILGEVALSINLGSYLILGISEEKSGGRSRASILSNAFEALLGAIYLDNGLDASRSFLTRHLFNRINDFLKDESNINYKSRILELAQRDGFGIPRYVTIDATGPDHAKQFKVRIDIAGVPMGEGQGTNKKVAQQNAAQSAIVNYNKDLINSRIKGDGKNELLS
ncbi:ribonuclease III [Chitinispirillales bacterium ANBcel5]|uniref:ribonuclease III n=1 Tax=Cellulosispirillum alkaliphilum TaxID=3039283 RepID=UPI002A596E89|nr:ribonuclease III [Chitinispirillales bacterium ANBcel5]